MEEKSSTDHRFILKEITYSKIHTLVMHGERGARNSTKFLTDQLTLSQPLLCPLRTSPDFQAFQHP